MNYFKDNLRYLRMSRGLILEELGAVIGKGKSQISQYESGINEPPMSIARQLARYFNLTLDELFERDIRPNNSSPPPRPPERPPQEGENTEGPITESRGVARAEPLPQNKGDDLKEMRKQMLDMMLKIESLDSAG